MKLVKTIYFDAAHKLNNYIGKCSNIHGHTWKVEIVIMFEDIPHGLYDTFNGILLDFLEIAKIKETFDHLYLNDVININPTAENLASIISLMVADLMFYRLKNVVSKNPLDQFTVFIKLWESKTSFIEVACYEARRWLGLREGESYRKFMKEFVEAKIDWVKCSYVNILRLFNNIACEHVDNKSKICSEKGCPIKV